MDSTQQGSDSRDSASKTPLRDPLADFLDSKAKTIDEAGTRSGTYVRELERVVPEWIDWMQTHRDVEYLDDLDGREMGAYAKHLAGQAKTRTQGDESLSAATAWNYYSYISAYLEYCSQWELIGENPAQTAVAKNAMPDRPSSSSGDQQFWSPEQRQILLQYMDREAHAAIDEQGSDALAPVRDRALVYVLAFSAVRGAEILQPPRNDDDRRHGITWDDLDLRAQTITVLGKSQDEEQAPLTDRPVAALERWRDVLAPAAQSWPVFPTLHLPTLRETAREQLLVQGANEGTIEAVIAEKTVRLVAAYREHDLTPPAMTTAGARYLLKTLTNEAGVDCSDDPKDYLTLHGARRGAGEAYYSEAGHEAAQRALRHADPETTSRMYSHLEASELSEVGSEVFEDE